jgi:RND superfamily putative drug exporter
VSFGAANRLGRIATRCYDHRRLVLGLWIAALVVVTGTSFSFYGVFANRFGGGHSQSQRAQDFLRAHFPTQAGDTAQVVFATTEPVGSARVRAVISDDVAGLRGLAHVASVRSPFDPGAGNQVSRDGHVAYATVQFDQTTDDLPKAAIQAVIDRARAGARAGIDVELGGSPIGKVQTTKPGSTEYVGVVAAVVILLVAFGSFIAMGLPILTALFSVALAFGVIDFMSRGLNVPTFASEVAAMIGIGVGIDYALFVVTRYRQGFPDGHGPRWAVAAAFSTSGRAVLFAGCTVVISLLGLILLGASFVYGLALGAIAAVVLVLAATLTLLPAVLGFVGETIDRFHLPRLLHRGEGSARSTLWWRWSRVVQRHPWLAGGSALAVLVVLAVPLLSLHLGFTDAGNDPATQMTRKSYDLLARGFGPGSNGPLVIALDLGGGRDGPAPIGRLGADLQRTSGVAFAVPPQFNARGDAAVLVVIPTTSPQDGRTQSLVHRIRADIVPVATRGTGVHALVGGETAASIDSSDHFAQRLPWVIGGVVGLSFLLLMAVFRSVAVPLKAAVMNLLSVGAAYGVVVAVFQWGWLGSVVGIDRTGPIDPWIPLMLFTILFGLSMDYEVFLLSRVREEWHRTGDNATAVADGVASTGRLITAAAAIMVCVFGSFVLGDIRVLKVFGLGLATAVLLDATLVRMVLVPSTMELMGRANWWFPHWLDRIVPTLSVEVDTGMGPSGAPGESAETLAGRPGRSHPASYGQDGSGPVSAAATSQVNKSET